MADVSLVCGSEGIVCGYSTRRRMSRGDVLAASHTAAPIRITLPASTATVANPLRTPTKALSQAVHSLPCNITPSGPAGVHTFFFPKQMAEDQLEVPPSSPFSGAIYES